MGLHRLHVSDVLAVVHFTAVSFVGINAVLEPDSPVIEAFKDPDVGEVDAIRTGIVMVALSIVTFSAIVARFMMYGHYPLILANLGHLVLYGMGFAGAYSTKVHLALDQVIPNEAAVQKYKALATMFAVLLLSCLYSIRESLHVEKKKAEARN